MDYRRRWQQRRRYEARKRLLGLAAAAVLILLVSLLVTRRGAGREQWRHEFHADGPVYFTARGGTLFCALPAGRAQALRVATGRPLWPAPFKRSMGFGVPPAASASVVVYVNDAGAVSALDPRTGQPLWQVETAGPVRCPPLAEGDALYVGSDDGNVYALQLSDGIERWRFPAWAPVNSGGVVVNGVFVFGTAEGKVLGVDVETGRAALWGKTIGVRAPIFATPARAGEFVAIGTDSSKLLLVDPVTGDKVAKADVPHAGLVRSSPVADAGALYVATTDGWVAAYDLRKAADTGELPALWVRRIGPEVSAGPALDERHIYCANGAGRLFALARSNGRIRARWQCPARAQGSLVVTRGLVIVATARGQVIAFKAPAR